MVKSRYSLLLFFLFFSVTGTAQVNLAKARVVEEAKTSSKQPYSQLPTAVQQHLLRTPLNMLTLTASAIEKALPIQFKFAQLLDSDVESMTNMRLFSFIDNWWGTRYRYGGDSKTGIDCSAFAGMLMREVFHIQLPRTAREQFSNVNKIDKALLKEGDLVFFNTRGGISHVGIFLKHGYFVHASTSRGVTISNLEEPYYKSRFLGGGRWQPEKVRLMGLVPFPGLKVFVF